ncbi:hypothetical protein D3C74_337500 [compost metagenome]
MPDAESPVTYAGAATQIVTSAGSRPACSAAWRTASIDQATMSGSASWRMKPSPTSPASARARGPYAATHTGVRLSGAQGRCRVVPWYSTDCPPASPRMVVTAARSSARVTGLPLVTRTAESPRPIPQTVRLPNMSLRVAKSEAVTVTSRVAGLVTMGPTVTRWVADRIWE